MTTAILEAECDIPVTQFPPPPPTLLFGGKLLSDVLVNSLKFYYWN